ncbi:MAG: rhomboid family intramembrane serine protease [Verrucomicrobiaceae bacterium]
MDTQTPRYHDADSLVPIASFDSLANAQEYALVVLAMNLDCLVTIQEDSYLIHAPEAFELAVKEEFRLYAEEQQNTAPPQQIPVFSSGFELLLIWIVALFFCYSLQIERPGFTDQYLNSSIAVTQGGEVFRSFTALFLHGSMEHLLGNIAFGSVFCLLVANSLGPWTGWGLILGSGFLGNLTNAFLHRNIDFNSLGASTATFGALGLLVGVGLYQAWLDRTVRSGLRVVAPLGVGLMLFSFLGIGDPSSVDYNTDVMAHLLGLFFGVLLALPVAKWRSRISAQSSLALQS